MNLRLVRPVCIFALLAALGMGPGVSPAADARETVSDVEAGMDVLTHGPIHEAFAETVALDPEPGIIVPKAPPDDIDELPPEQKPGGDVDWIPGYWAWDDDRNDFIWISGIWRAVPPNRQWIPGYWIKVENSFQWVSGYWAPETEINTQYLPEPPESVEAGPNIDAPTSDYGWVPGCWIWLQGRYMWRPGYWELMRPNWVWVPDYYVWTPRGYIFIEGYWDFAVVHRGVLFSPVFFGVGIPIVHGYHFTPSVRIDLNVFSDCLFLRPGYHHYYFGDYYAVKYYRGGIYPWFSPHVKRHYYDPIYAHQRWEHRHDRNWEKNLYAKYQERRNNVASRPPRDLRHDGKPDRKGTISRPRSRTSDSLVAPVTKRKKGSSGFRSLSRKERSQIDQQRREVDRYRKSRQNWESRKPAQRDSRSFNKTGIDRVRFPKSPIAAKPTHRVDRQETPPNRYGVPKPDPTVEPLKRGYSGVQERNNGQRPDSRNRNENSNRERSDNRGKGANNNQRNPN
jgi:WXXGXW repeat (2 copies)